MASRNPHLTLTCACTHAGMHHRGRCRIPRCTCPKFTTPAPIRRIHDSTWLQHGTPYRQGKGHGP